MPKIVTFQQIKDLLQTIPTSVLFQGQEEGFIAYSQGKVKVPPVGYLGFQAPRADVHIKYGCIEGDDYYVIKIASGFYENETKYNLPNSNGLVLVFSSKTGEVLGILLDECYLTEVRTAIAGAIAAKYLAPKNVKKIGIVGAGTQARFQLRFLKDVVETKSVIVWGRDQTKLDKYKKDMEAEGFQVETTLNISDVTANCQLIVTTTPANNYLLPADQIKEGTHITAMGADTKGKQEIDPQIFQKASIVVADSVTQCVDHGEVHYGIQQGLLQESNVIELGKFLYQKDKFERKPTDITIADLTGVAVQDIQIAKTIFLNSH